MALLEKENFQAELDGETVELYPLSNTFGDQLFLTNYGARVVSWTTGRGPASNDVVLGFPELRRYLEDDSYQGAIVGRVANRIAKARFEFQGQSYELSPNNGKHLLHGGADGLSTKVWKLASIGQDSVTFFYRSPDGEGGFPGNVSVWVTYSIEEPGSLKISYKATSDQDTPLNLTSHMYFNLDGEGSGDVLGHRAQLFATRYLPTDAEQIPTGELAPVGGSPFDLNEPAQIGTVYGQSHAQLDIAGGFDHCFLIDEKLASDQPFAVMEGAGQKVRLQVYTTEPAFQFYTGNAIEQTAPGKSGTAYRRFSGFCIETGGLPDSLNHKNFPSSIIRAGEEFHSHTTYTLTQID